MKTLIISLILCFYFSAASQAQTAPSGSVARIKQQINRIWDTHKVEPFDHEKNARLRERDPDRATREASGFIDRERVAKAKIRTELLNLAQSIAQTRSAETIAYELGILMEINLIDDPLYGRAENVVNLIRTLGKVGNQPYRRVSGEAEYVGWTHAEFFDADPRLTRIPTEELDGETYYASASIPAYLSVIGQMLREYETLEHGSTDRNANKVYGGYYGDNLFSHITVHINSSDFQKTVRPWLATTIQQMKTHSLRGKMLYHTGQYASAARELELALTEHRQKGWRTDDLELYRFAAHSGELLLRNPALRSGLPGKGYPVGWQQPKHKNARLFVVADFNEDGLLDEAILLTNKDVGLNSGMAIFVYINQPDKKYRVQKITTTDLKSVGNRVFRLTLKQEGAGNEPINGLGATLIGKDEDCCEGHQVEIRWDKARQQLTYSNL
ncbi:hypothetical protein F5984_09215 [Rudanella paleaurantiibacter]|uniref:VCBS repeat-containing protein n=1 Tax=Rudanella paleaurantiibacter TaxID=2614655 RepID=A0A7J5U006_9BACT|nr:hypothetical protein [Rudanella paleaurantiibacter]KAB7730999.1 hypothetical protein F5984_09215 [Rudanella paleaurantiibacter]